MILLNKFFIICGPNVIESEEQIIRIAQILKTIFAKYDVQFIFKTSFDKANRTSLNSYRGLGFEEGIRILKKIKDDFNIPIITDIHESWQANEVAKIVDIIQIPAFLCRQTDLLKAAAETGKIIHIKKGQFCSAEQMHKCKEKIISFGNTNIILCERGNSFGYHDLVVDPRNLIWLKSATNLVSMDITHCLQQPSQKMADGTVKSGGYRDLIPYMGKMALALDINGIFLEVHENPDNALCDGPTQWPLDKLEWLLDYLDIKKIKDGDFIYKSSTIKHKYDMNIIEKDALGLFGKFAKENVRGRKILDKFLEFDFKTVLDIGAGGLEHSEILYNNNKIVDIADFGNSECFTNSVVDKSIINNSFFGDFNNINFEKKYDAVWTSHTLEHQLNPNLFLKKINSLLNDGGILGIVIPIRKPIITDGHVSIWNAGLLVYNLVLANFDCSNCKILQYDYNIGIVLKKKYIELPNLAMDQGDLEKLSEFLPPGFVSDKINSDIMEYNFYENQILEKCILCKNNLDNYEIVYDKKIRGDINNKCKIVKCKQCGHIQLIGFRNNLQQHYEEDEQSNDIVKTFNITKQDIIEREKIEIDRRLKYLDIKDNEYKLLDIGSGYCSFAKRLVDKNKNIEVTCLEPSINRTNIGKGINSINKMDKIIMINIYLDEIFVNSNKNKYDFVTSWHVFEHLDENFIDTVLINMYKCCKVGGKIIIEVPHSEDELFKIDKYKEINYMIHHLSYWNEDSLTKLLNNNLIKNFKFEYVQRYGYNNYLNWVYNLGEKQNCNMNNDNKHLTWLNAKKKAKNTDAILLIIEKT